MELNQPNQSGNQNSQPPVSLTNWQFWILFLDGKKTYIVAAIGMIFNLIMSFVVSAYPWTAPAVPAVNWVLGFAGLATGRQAIAKVMK